MELAQVSLLEGTLGPDSTSRANARSRLTREALQPGLSAREGQPGGDPCTKKSGAQGNSPPDAGLLEELQEAGLRERVRGDQRNPEATGAACSAGNGGLEKPGFTFFPSR